MHADRALQVLHAQARASLDEAAVLFSDAVARHAAEQARLVQAQASLDASLQEMRRVASATSINVVTYEALRGMKLWEQAQVNASEDRARACAQALDAARMGLGHARQVESGLSHAIDTRQHEQRMGRERQVQTQLDDQWLHSRWRRT